jgi:hypothetical protein
VLQHPVPDDHLKAIGDITVSFAMLESQMQSLIGSLVYEHQRIGQIITAELSFGNLRALLISLYLERHGEDGDFIILRKFMKRAGQTEDKRNQISHSVWAAGKDKDHITRFKTTAKEKYGIKFKFEEVSAETLNEFAKDIKILAEEILRFQFDLLDRHKIINSPIKKFWP